MDILDELGLTGVLPEHSDISLDDILAEFATPGLFSASAPPSADVDDILSFVQDAPDASADASAADLSEDDGVKVYIPKTKAEPAPIPTAVSAEGETIPFAAVDLPAAEQPQQQKKKRLSLKERFVAWKSARSAAKTSKKSVPPQSEEELMVDAMASAELNAWLEDNDRLFEKKEDEKDPFAEFEEAPLSEEAPTPAIIPDAPMTDAMMAALAMEEDPEGPAHDGAADFSLDLSPEATEGEDKEVELSDLLETDEEEAAQAAARYAEADEALRYVPGGNPVKNAAATLAKRFLTAVNAVGGDSDTLSEDALGAEVTPIKARKFFAQHMGGYGFRVKIAAAMSLVLCWFALGLPVFGSLKNPSVAAAACLMLLLTVMLAGVDVFTTGFRSLLQRRPGAHTLVTMSCLASVLDAVIIILSEGTVGYLPFCAVSALSMTFAIYGSLLYCGAQEMNFRTLAKGTNPNKRKDEDKTPVPMTISVDDEIVDKFTSTAYRTPGIPEEYIHRSEEEDLSESVHSVMAPILMLGIPVLSLIAALLSRSMGDIFHIMSAMFAVAASFSALLAFPLPYFLAQSYLSRGCASIAGWAGARDLGQVDSMLITDRDLFPESSVVLDLDAHIVPTAREDLMLSHMCSLVVASDCCLSDVFRNWAERNDYALREVENLTCIQSDAISCNIGPDEVLVCNRAYLVHEGYKLPAPMKAKGIELFLVIQGHLMGLVHVDYKATHPGRNGLIAASNSPVEPILAARNFHINPKLIEEKFKTSAEALRCPSYQPRVEMTARMNADTAACAAFVYRPSLLPYVTVVQRAKRLYRTVTTNVTLTAISVLLGILLVFILSAVGSTVTAGRLLIYMLPWLFPTWTLSAAINE